MHMKSIKNKLENGDIEDIKNNMEDWLQQIETICNLLE